MMESTSVMLVENKYPEDKDADLLDEPDICIKEENDDEAVYPEADSCCEMEPTSEMVVENCPVVTDIRIAATVKPEIKEETEDEEIYPETDSCCEVKMEDSDCDDQASVLGNTNRPYQVVSVPYVSAQIPYEDDNVTTIPGSPSEKPYFCNFCDYRTRKTSALAQHVRTHTGEKPYACELCDFKSSTGGSLKRHVRRHTGEKPYPCNECEYRGTSASDLQVHMRSHDAGKSFNCDACGYRGTTSWNLREHLKTHTGDKPYSCHLCEFKCSASGSLKRHVKRHTGEKPYHCDICKYRCSSSSDLKVHKLIHLSNDEKPFPCKLCDWRGVTNGQLRSHMKSHGKPNFYECSICGLKAGRINNLRNHMKTHDKQINNNPSIGKSTRGKPHDENQASSDLTNLASPEHGESANSCEKELLRKSKSGGAVLNEKSKDGTAKVELTDPS